MYNHKSESKKDKQGLWSWLWMQEGGETWLTDLSFCVNVGSRHVVKIKQWWSYTHVVKFKQCHATKLNYTHKQTMIRIDYYYY